MPTDGLAMMDETLSISSRHQRNVDSEHMQVAFQSEMRAGSGGIFIPPNSTVPVIRKPHDIGVTVTLSSNEAMRILNRGKTPGNVML